MRRIFPAFLFLALLAGCALDRNRNSSEREWARAECDRIIDRDAREKCMRRVDGDFGGSSEEKPKDPKAKR